MFDLYEMTAFPVSFPSKLLGIYTSRDDLIRDLKLTMSEAETLLDGDVIRDKYFLMPTAKLNRILDIGDIVATNPEGLKEREIAEVKRMTLTAVKQTIRRAKVKLKINKLKTCLCEIVERQRFDDYSLTSECSSMFTSQ